MTVENRHIGGPHQRVGVEAPAVPNEAPDAGPVEVKGEYKGMEVVVADDPSSAIADATEELTFSLADTVERKIFDRKVAKREGVNISPTEVAKAELLSKKLRGLNPADLKRLLQLLRQDRPATAEELRLMAKQAFPDATACHAALEFVRECIADQDDDDADMLAMLDSVLIAMEESEGPAIRAGYNIDQMPLTGLATPDQHRETYRENVLSFRNAGDSFSDLLRQYGEDGVEEMLDYLIGSLAVDMESLSPSLDRERLAMVNDGLATARGLVNTLDGAKELVHATGCDRGRKTARASELTNVLLEVKDGKIRSGVELKMRLPLLEGVNPTRDVELLKGFIELARRVPDRLYRDGAARQATLDVVQTALDEAVELEEKVLDGL